MAIFNSYISLPEGIQCLSLLYKKHPQHSGRIIIKLTKLSHEDSRICWDSCPNPNRHSNDVAMGSLQFIQICLLIKWVCLEIVYPPTLHFNDENDEKP